MVWPTDQKKSAIEKSVFGLENPAKKQKVAGLNRETVLAQSAFVLQVGLGLLPRFHLCVAAVCRFVRV
jgi:hypothetical protein